MTSTERVTGAVLDIPVADIEAALDPVESDGVYRDSRECSGLLQLAGGGPLLLSPPTPHPKKG